MTTQIVPVDPRSEAAIATLHGKVQPIARTFVQLCAANGIKVEITSGTRTYAEQQALFDKHNGTTRAPAGYSNHNFGLAFDVTIDAQPDDALQPVWESPLYKKLGTLGETLGLTWGGRWQSIDDEPHFELHPPWANGMTENQMLTELRRRHDKGIDAFA
jgi:peptidoglycan LD-endopeptidase CwlK